MENEMKIVAWKQFTNENKQSTYKLQLEGSLSTKERKKILAELKGWTEVGYGWYKTAKKNCVCLLDRFRTEILGSNGQKSFRMI